ncbi:MAG TPA: hypothetical protein VH054_21355, partial [Polyangiaceae bacterium]|nr:hypothetical protein [Polyangiaceae bacterium]
MGGSTTSPYVESEREPRAEIRRYHTLVMLWSADEDERVGEDAPLEGAGPWIIARDDPPSRSTPFQYQRGGVSVVTGGLTGKNVSRKLLTLDVTDMLEIRGIGGTVPVTVNREPAQIGMKLRAGDLIEIHKRYLLLVAERTSPFVRVDKYP